MQQQMSLVTLGVAELPRSRRFYAEGFGWKPVFETPEIIFYQLNGFVLSTWLTTALEKDMQLNGLTRPDAFALAHKVASREDVDPAIERLVLYGGRLLRKADAPPHGGFRGYLTDPDDHPWEIAWNPAWPISPEGYVRFGT